MQDFAVLEVISALTYSKYKILGCMPIKWADIFGNIDRTIDKMYADQIGRYFGNIDERIDNNLIHREKKADLKIMRNFDKINCSAGCRSKLSCLINTGLNKIKHFDRT